jgi:NitT/TauT family transport system ATP-binding protein
MTVAVDVLGAAKTFGDGPEAVHAFGPIDLEIEGGSFVALLGPSGCGKSTLLLMIAGLLAASNGEIRLGGHPVAGPQTDIGIVFQSHVLVDWRDVLGNVLLQIDLRGLSREAYLGRARELLRSVGLEQFATRRPYELSGGMQQRAAIARALVHDPKLVLMDEPFGALDALTREKMNLELLRIWKEAGKTIVFVTHGISEAVFLGTRVVVLTAGPARMADNFIVDLPHPRTLDMKTHERFGEYTRRIYRLLGME